MSDTRLSLVLDVLAFCRRCVLQAEMMADESHEAAPSLMDLPWADDEGLITDYKCPPPELEKIRGQYQLLPSEEADSSDDESTSLLESEDDWEPPSPALPGQGPDSSADESTPLLGSEVDGESFQSAFPSEGTDSSSAHIFTPPPDQDDGWGPYQRARPKEETDLFALDPTPKPPSNPAVHHPGTLSSDHSEAPPLQNHTPQGASPSNPHPTSSIQDLNLDHNSLPPLLALSAPTHPCLAHDLEKYDLSLRDFSDRVDRLHKTLCAGDNPV